MKGPEPPFSEYHEGVISKFDISALEVPLDSLKTHLSKKFDDIRFINPRIFEKLCRDVLADHFDCEVRLTGYSHDEGVDLYLLDSDTPRAVQLKRRSTSVAEGVAPVREFLGALVANEVDRGLFISTAPSFTRGAKELVKRSSLYRRGLQIELLDAHGLESMFHRRRLVDKPWKKIPTVRTPHLCGERGLHAPRFEW